MDLLKRLKQEAKSEYLDRLKQIDSNSKVYRLGNILELKLRKYFPDCTIDSSYTYVVPTIRLYLTKDLNIANDVNAFLEHESDFIDFSLNGSEMRAKDYMGISYDIMIGGIRLEVHYEGGNCKRVKIREDIQVVPIYEVVCN